MMAAFTKNLHRPAKIALSRTGVSGGLQKMVRKRVQFKISQHTFFQEDDFISQNMVLKNFVLEKVWSAFAS